MYWYNSVVKGKLMETPSKYDKILDALQELLQNQDIEKISVSDIAEKAGIGKSSIYYYFPSKDAIIDALVERNYKKPLETAKNLAKQTHMSPFVRMAIIFQACRNSSIELAKQDNTAIYGEKSFKTPQEHALIHQKFLKYIITELKPALTEIIKQGIENGDIQFSQPEQLAEISLIVLAVKLDNTLVPSTSQEIEQTIRALISLLEKGTETPSGSLDYMIDMLS